MREFWVRLVSMLAIVGVLLGYNSVLDVRAKEDEIAPAFRTGCRKRTIRQ